MYWELLLLSVIFLVSLLLFFCFSSTHSLALCFVAYSLFLSFLQHEKFMFIPAYFRCINKSLFLMVLKRKFSHISFQITSYCILDRMRGKKFWCKWVYLMLKTHATCCLELNIIIGKNIFKLMLKM